MQILQAEKMGNAGRCDIFGVGKWMCMVGKQGGDQIQKEKKGQIVNALECPTDLKEIPFCMQLASFFFGNSTFRFLNCSLISKKIYQEPEGIEVCGFLRKIISDPFFFFLAEVEISVYTLDLGSLLENNLFVGESSFTCYFFLLIKQSHLSLVV